ncbi:fibrobacter succinogenes major paralogous domain-containing protein [bacterium]|nr:fibrobacter succinogenes major paralogous domain-containing protein [bacterium]
MLNSDDLLLEIWGNYQDPLALTTTTDFFQSQFGGLFAHEINPLFFAVLPSVQYDSWLTIGISQAPNSANGESEISYVEYTEDNWRSEFESGNDLEIYSSQGGSWFVPSNSVNGLPDSENQRVLIAQLTTSGNIAGVVNAGVYVNGLESSEVRPRFDFEGTGTFYDSIITFGCIDSLACNYSGDILVDIQNCLYSEEGYDCDGICLSDYDGDGVCNEFEIAGCTFSVACNYNPEATDDDGSCEFYCAGCTDELACNYDSGAIQEDGSCQYPIDIYGLDYVDCDGICITDTDFDGVCDEEETFGCTDEEACNFLPEATQDDGGCLIPNLVACEICIGEEVVLADVDGDGVCDADEIEGCTDPNGCNYDPIATDEDGSCSYPLDICGESYFDCSCACLNDADGDEVCDEEEIAGCQDPIACNYNSEATDPAPCETTSCAGCIYPYACNYDPEAVYSDGSCEFGTCAGCTNPAACNFNPTVFEDDGSCQFLDECGVCGGEGPAAGFYCDGTCIDTDGDTVCDVDEAGCTDEAACNYNALVNEDDGSCSYADDCFDCNEDCFDLNANQICDCQEVLGCLDETACNYNPLANIESGACLYPEPLLDCNGNCLNDADEDGVCDEEDDCPLDPQNDIDGDGICANEEIFGCSDPSACNYEEGATEDDGSCILVEAAVDSAYTQGFNDGMAAGVESVAAEQFCGEGTVWDSGFELCIPSDCFGDFNDDGERGTEDLLQLLAVFGTSCPSEEVTLFTCGNPVSYHGYDYETVLIGEQCWFAENLRTEHYGNGDAIAGELNDEDWSSTTAGAQAVYGEGASGCNGECDEIVNLDTFGRLYNWYAVDDARGLCPSGWHVPTDGEWMTLEMELGMSSSEANSTDWRGTDQGTQMKSSPSDTPSWNGTNLSGFSALAGGWRGFSSGDFGSGGSSCYWWSASLNGTSFAWIRYLGSDDVHVYRDDLNPRFGFSIRCVRD